MEVVEGTGIAGGSYQKAKEEQRPGAGSPEIVVEIGSKSTRKRDETIKRRLYERRVVLEYWVIDPQLDVVRVYRLDTR